MRLIAIVVCIFLVACTGVNTATEVGPPGPQGEQGVQGQQGEPGATGESGSSPLDIAGRSSVSSGTRLIAQMTTTITTSDDGAKLIATSFSGWYDSLTNESCSPALMVDGNVHCISFDMQGSNSGLFYDSACSKPIYSGYYQSLAQVCGGELQHQANPVKVATEDTTTSPGCSYAHVYTVSKADYPTNWYEFVNGGCVDITNVAGSLYDSSSFFFYSIKSEVNPTSFATMNVTTSVSNVN